MAETRAGRSCAARTLSEWGGLGGTLDGIGEGWPGAQLSPDQLCDSMDCRHVLPFGVNDPHSPACVLSPNCSVALWNSSPVKTVLLSLTSVISASVLFRPSTI
jgi:hypothetical protein